MLFNVWQRYLRRVSQPSMRRFRHKQVAGYCEPLENRTLLSTLFVDNGGDSHLDSKLSLREAIAQANIDALAGTSDTITFSPALGSQTISLTQGQLEFSGAGSGVITIDGSSLSSPVTIDAHFESRIFQIDVGVHVVLTHLNLQNGIVRNDNGGAIFNAGVLTVSNSNISNSRADNEDSGGFGGAIENQATLTLSNVSFFSNSAAQAGGAIDNTGTLSVIDSTLTSNNADSGGAISNSGTLTLSNSNFTQNYATESGGAIVNRTSSTLVIHGGYFGQNQADSGGAIANATATATLNEVTLSRNTAYTSGGAIDTSSGSLSVTNSTLDGNQGPLGGAINNVAGTLTISGSTLSNNTGSTDGGAISNRSQGILSLSNSTLVGNTSYGNGGGIENDASSATLVNSTLAANIASGSGGGIDNQNGTLAIQNSIVSVNRAFGGSGGADIQGPVTTDSGYNLFGTGVNNTTNDPTPGPFNVFSDVPGLGTVGDYGGPTPTIALLAGSPAIGKGKPASTAETDQRGQHRLAQGGDIGAFQTQLPTLALVSLSQTFAAGTPATLTLELHDLNGMPVAATGTGVNVTLASNSAGATFLDAFGNPLTGSSITIPVGGRSVTFQYKDTVAGSPTLTFSAAGFASSTQQEFVLPAPISNTPSSAIVTGRVLSSYTTGGIQNNQETITFTVYNEQADPLTGVLLTDILAPGVTIVSASIAPDQTGQKVAWSLGTIPGYDRASVTLTVSLPASTPLQLDAGAQAFAILNAGAVSDAAPAATLISGSVNPNFLRSTPDANTTDPFIQEAAAKLDYNPQNIFDFLQQDIGYNAYAGSLRGARGTLWSSAGNALDVASLGVALMRASGIPAEYAQGTLSYNQSQQLILSMFPPSFQTVGYIPAGTQTANPANEFQLQNDTQRHFWFQFDAGGGMQDADPLMSGARIGQTFTPNQGTFTEVPANLRQTTTIQLTAETYSTASAAFGFGDGLSQTVVLDQTFYDVDLYGRPLTIGHFVNSSSISALVVSASTNIYTPYIVLGDEALPDSSLPEAILGTPIQEVFTNFPFGTQILTGLFLKTTLKAAGASDQTFSQTLVDRIGFAVREGLVQSSASADPNGPPIISPFDLTTLNILPGLQSLAATRLAQARADQALASLSANGGPTTVAQVQALIAIAQSVLANFALTSDGEAANLASGYSVAAYFSAPRIAALSTKYVTDNNESHLTFNLNLVHDSIRTVGKPGQNVLAMTSFAGARGVFDSFLEAQSVPVLPGGVNLSSATIIQQSIQEGITLVAINASNQSLLQTLDLPVEAIARISSEIQDGLSVIVPSRSVIVNGTPTTAWWVVNTTTGEILSQGQDGSFQGLSELSTGTLITAIITGAAFNVFTSDLIENKSFFKRPHGEQAKILFIGGLSGILNFTFFGILGSLALAYDFSPIGPLAQYDPPVSPLNVNLNIPFPTSPGATASNGVEAPSNLTAGQVNGTIQVANAVASGDLTAAWSSTATSSFMASALTATTATVVNSQGVTVGSGLVSLSASSPVAVAISGNGQYNVNGQGSLSFFAPAETQVGVSGDWAAYSTTVTGPVSAVLQASSLMLNGVMLPAGKYTITTNSAQLTGSGSTTSPNFSGAVSIHSTGGTFSSGRGTGNLTSGGAALDPTTGITLDGYTGAINVTANGNGTDTITLDGTSTAVLAVKSVPGAITTNQNTPVMLQASISTSLADNYTVTVQAPLGWATTIDSTGKISLTPAPGLQGGSYPVQIVARSTTNSKLVAQSTVSVTMTPTAPGITLTVDADPIYTVPFNGAHVPTAFRAVIHNSGPTADTFNLTVPNLPSGFTVIDSASSVTIPAGQTAIVGIYLQPSGTLPVPGTQVSFSFAATSVSAPAMTRTVTKSFAMPVIDAVIITSDPPSVSSIPGLAATTTVTLKNVGNVDSNASVVITTSDGLTVSGIGTAPIAIPVGGSVTQTLTLTPAATASLNTTLIATVNVGPAATQDVVSILSVTPRPAFATAGQTLNVSADLFAGVLNPRAARVSYVVKDHLGNPVFTSTAVPLNLEALPQATTLALGAFDTTGLSAGEYSVTVTVTETGGQIIAGATGTGTVLIGSPVTASLSLDSNTHGAEDTATVLTTLSVTNQALLGGVQTDGTASTVAFSGSLAYVAGTQNLSIVDISNPANPKVLGTFGANDLSHGGTNFVRRTGTQLVVVSQSPTNSNAFNLIIYSLTDPQHPQLVSSTAIPYRFAQGLEIQGTTAYVPTSGITFGGGGAIADQFGDFVAIDISNPASPQLKDVLFNDRGTPNGHNTNQRDVLPVNNQVAYVLGGTSTGNNTQTGTGRVLIVNTTNTAQLATNGELNIPGTIQALAIAIDGNHALVVGSTGGLLNNFGDLANAGLTGNVTLTLLDTTDPSHPTIIGSTVVTANTFPTGGQDSAAKLTVVALGQGRFAVSGTLKNTIPVILGVDASNSANLITSTLRAATPSNGMSADGNHLYVTSESGLQVYETGALFSQSVTAEVDIPNGGPDIDPSTFSLLPSRIVNGPTSQKLIWNFNLAPGASQIITWEVPVDVLPGTLKTLVSGATIQFENLGTEAEFSLPGLEVAGVPTTQNLQIPLQVVVPGVQAIAEAAAAAAQIGNSDLSNQFQNLTIALTNLVQDPANAVYLSQTQATLTSLISQTGGDPFLTPFTGGLSAAQTALANATTSQQIETAVVNLGTALETLAHVLTDEALHGFTLGLVNDIGIVQPGVPTLFNITLTNTGTATTTYHFSVTGLPAGVTATFSSPQITLAPNAFIPNGGNTVTVSLSQSGDTLLPGSFTVTATAEGAPEITLNTPGRLTLRDEALQVGSVVTNPPFTNAGGQVAVSAKIQSVVNEPHRVAVTYVVKNGAGTVVFASPTPVMADLTITSGLTTVELGNLDTTGFAQGLDTIVVTVVDQSNQPLPSVTGRGSVSIGLPVTANLTVSPTVAPTGSLTVTNTLQINGTVTLPDPLTLDDQVPTTPTSNTVELFQDATHKLAYVAGNNGIDIVDVSDPSNLAKLSTFAAGDIILGGATVGRVDMIGGTNYLLVGTTLTINANQFTLLIYSLADPLNPTKVSSTVVPYQFLQEMLVQGNTILVPTAGVSYFPPNSIFDQFGSVLSVDVSNPAAPHLKDELFNNRGAPAGGDTRQSGGVFVNNSIAYICSTTSTGGNINSGVGRVLIVDYSDPTNLILVGEVQVPGTLTVSDITIEGNQALIVGATKGGDLLGQQGNLTLSVLDISDPRNPQQLGRTLDTGDQFGSGRISALPLGNGLYAVSDAVHNGIPQLILVDASNPDSLVFSESPRTTVVNEMAVSGNILYTTGTDGLTTYTIGQIVTVPVTASVEIPNTTGVSVVAGSYNNAPSQIIHSASFDTLVWNLNLAFGNTQPTLTWQSQVSNLTTDEVRPVTLGATVNFTSNATPGSFSLPGSAVTGAEIVSLTPATQTAQPNATALYTIRLSNPTDAQVTYRVALLPGNTSYFATAKINHGNNFITLPAQSVLDVPLELASYEFSALGDNPFTIDVTNANGNGTHGSVGGHLVLAGPPIVKLTPDPDSHGVFTTLTPAQSTTGQGTTADYVLQLTNTGSVEATYSIQVNGLPFGIDYQIGYDFGGSYPSVPPGASNFRNFSLRLTPFPGTAPGNYPFTVTTTQYSDPSVSSTITGTLTVVASGVEVNLDQSTVSPGGTLRMTISNTGTASDTFDLSVAGPGGLIASLGTTSVTLAPGRSQTVSITTTPVDFAVSGALTLVATATSRTNSNIKNADIADIVIPATQGLGVRLQPGTKVIPVPGTSTFILLVNNLGNTEDAYVATIAGINGPVSASLIGLDGQLTQTIPMIRLPGLTTGAILLQTNLTAEGLGTVSIQVQSLNNAQLKSTAIATVTTNDLAIPTVTVNGGSFTFDGQAHPATGTVTGTDNENLGIPTLTYTDGNNVSTSNPPVNAGTYTVTASFAGNSTYSAASNTATIVIARAAPTVNVTGGNFGFDSNAHAATGSVIGVGGVNLGAPTFTYTANSVTTSNPPVNVGTYTVTASFAGNTNYLPASNTATILIAAVLPNSAPTDILLSTSSLAENQPAGTSVGTFSTIDPDSANTFTYALVTGAGSDDNASFTLAANGQLTISGPLDFETKSTLLIRVKTTDQGGLSFEKSFTITVTNIDEPPEIVLTPGVRRIPVPIKKVAFDAQATIRDVDTPVVNLSNSTLQVKVTQHADKTDKVRLLKPKHQDLAIKGKKIYYQGVQIAERIYGKKGQVPLTVKFNAAATQPGVEAVLKKIYYKTKGVVGATKLLEFSLTGLANGQSSKTTKDVQLG